MNMETKKCVTCKKEKSVSEFGRYKDGYQKQCKECAREYYLKNKNKKKNKTPVSVYFDDLQLKALDKKVKALNTNRSEFILNCTLNNSLRQIIKIDFKSLDSVAYEINKIGVNINQIAHIANSENHIYKSDIQYIKECQERIEEILCNYYDVVLKLQKKVQGK